MRRVGAIQALSGVQARRIALSAQGFGDPRPAGVADMRSLRRVVGRTGLFQIDSVNVLTRAHYLPLFSRLGPYPVELLNRAAYSAPRRLFEYWGHEASLLPVHVQPLLRWRMADAEAVAWGNMAQVFRDRPEFVAQVRADVAAQGPISAGQMQDRHGGRTRKAGPWWDWSHVKLALEYLFWAGEVTTAARRGFERMYDIPERVLPAQVLATPTPDRDQAQRELLMLAARSCGVATARDLRDYYRLPAADAKARLAELVEDGALLPVTVQGWRQPAYLHPQAKLPRKVDARALVAPFDPLVWERERTERIFGFRYRIEIYVPAHLRVHGYYVLPFLLGEDLVARVDLKADRQAGVLRVQSAHAEPGAPQRTGRELAAELESMAGWLGLSAVSWAGAAQLGPLPS